MGNARRAGQRQVGKQTLSDLHTTISGTMQNAEVKSLQSRWKNLRSSVTERTILRVKAEQKSLIRLIE